VLKLVEYTQLYMNTQLENVIYMETSLWRVRTNTPLYNAGMTFLHTKFGTIRNGICASFFPGPQPVSIERRHFDYVRQHQYVVCEKTDGVRHVLMCFKFDGKKVVLLVNRNTEFYVVPIRVQHTDILLDGELVKTHDGAWLYMVYDAIEPGTFPERFQFANTVISKIMRLTKDPFRVQLKTFYGMDQFSTFLSQTYHYETDGFVLTPVNEPIKVGTHETMFKWKPLEQNTIDFQLKKRPSSTNWGLYIQDKGVLVYECEIPYDNQYQEDQIVECKFIREGYTWQPIKVRDDKNYPNARRTFYRTMINLRENIQVGEFM
jgi:hypothetical protein